MKNLLITVVMAGVAAIGSGACATKGFVRSNVADVSDKLNTLSTSLEQTENRAQANGTRIREVDQVAAKAVQAANGAGAAATKAADLAATVDREIDALEKARLKLIYDVVMNEQ